MFIEKLNHKTEEEIRQLKGNDKPIVLLCEEKPDLEKLKLLNEFFFKDKTDCALNLETRDVDWIDLNDFKVIRSSVDTINFLTFTINPKFENLNGIELFKNLERVSFKYLYSNKIDFEKLTSCPKLEYISIENSLTKKHHLALSKLKGLKELRVKGLDVSLLEEMPNLEKLYVLGLKNGEGLDSKMPNLKTICIHYSNKLKSLDFIKGLKYIEGITLNGISNVESIPNLNHLQHLKGFSLMNMKRLKNFPELNMELIRLRIGKNVPSLETEKLKHINSKNLPNLESIEINLNTVGESDIILKQLEK